MKRKYQEIKDSITSKINSGFWKEGEQITSEIELAKEFGVSRMTANRAIKELAGEGVLNRVFGLGTFVNKQVPQAPLFEIRNIAEEIRERGHRHTASVILLKKEVITNKVALLMELPAGTKVYHSIIVHSENDVPVQLEERYINPALAPDYLEQDFEAITPNEYLMAVTPFTEAEHIIESVSPNKKSMRLLELDCSEPCLLLSRRAWVGSVIASNSTLLYPGSRYRLGGRFVRQARTQG